MSRNYPGKLRKVDGLSKMTRMVIAEEDIKNAFEQCGSISDAAYQLNISQITFRKYAGIYKDETGKTYLELFNERPSTKAPNRYKGGSIGREKMEKILKGEQTNTVKSLDQFKSALLRYGFFREECCGCGYTGRRGRDLRSPLLVTFRDGDEKNGKQDNIEMLCFNCTFELCDHDSQFMKIVKDSMEELSATNSLLDKTVEIKDKETNTEPTFEESEELMDFLSKNGFDFR